MLLLPLSLEPRTGVLWQGKCSHLIIGWVLIEARRAKYFIAATQLVEPADGGRNLISLQTVLCLALFSLSINAISLCGSYTSAASAAALRLGLDESPSGLSSQERALRTRIWSTIKALDSYVSSILGLPTQSCLQSGPTARDDRYPTLADVRVNIDLDTSSSHSKLMDILSLIVNMYSVRGQSTSRKHNTFIIRAVDIKLIEDKLARWTTRYSLGSHQGYQSMAR